MRLINSIMSIQELSENDICKISKIFRQKYTNTLEIQKFKYDDRKYYEVDFDLINIKFQIQKIQDELNKLIACYEKIFQVVHTDIDIIAANDDTETEILKYEQDHNDIKSFGLFATTRVIPNIRPYYSSDICNVYLNFENVSFGVVF